MIDSKQQEQLRSRYNPEGSQLRRAQLRMVEMLCFIDKVCQEHKITYWISFGTLIGAVRHRGFIPWDDDADICMPLEDLRKFKQIMLYNNPSNEFVLQCQETDPGYNRQWVVLRDLRTEYLKDDKFHNNLKYRGLQVDIFPVETNVSMKLKYFADFVQRYFISRPSVSNKWYYNIIKPFRTIFVIILKYVIIPFCRNCKNRQNSNAYVISYGVPIPFKFVGEKSDIFPLQRILFENVEFYAPNKYEEYLSNLYGDWENVPSHSNIKTHHVKIVFK